MTNLRRRISWMLPLGLLLLLTFRLSSELVHVRASVIPPFPRPLPGAFTKTGCQRSLVASFVGSQASLGLFDGGVIIPAGKCLLLRLGGKGRARSVRVRYRQLGDSSFKIRVNGTVVGDESGAGVGVPGDGGQGEQTPRSWDALLRRLAVGPEARGVVRSVKLRLAAQAPSMAPRVSLVNEGQVASLGNVVLVTSVELIRPGGVREELVPGADSTGRFILSQPGTLLALVLLFAAWFACLQLGGATIGAGLVRLSLCLAGYLAYVSLSKMVTGIKVALSRGLMGTSVGSVEAARVDLLVLSSLLVLVVAWPTRSASRPEGGGATRRSVPPLRERCSAPGQGLTPLSPWAAGVALSCLLLGLLLHPLPALAFLAVLALLWGAAAGPRSSAARGLAAGAALLAVLSLGVHWATRLDSLRHLLTPSFVGLLGTMAVLAVALTAAIRAGSLRGAMALQLLLLIGLDLQAGHALTRMGRAKTAHLQASGEFATEVIPWPRVDQWGKGEQVRTRAKDRKRLASGLRLAAFGGSVVAGSGVTDHLGMFVTRTGLALTRSLGRPVFALNFAKGGHSTHHAYRGAVGNRLLRRFAPRLVVAMTGYNECTREARLTLRQIEARALALRAPLGAVLTSASLSRLLGRGLGTISRWRARRSGDVNVEQVPPVDGRANLTGLVVEAGRLAIPVLLISESTFPSAAVNAIPGGHLDPPGRAHKCRATHRALQQELARRHPHVGYLGMAEWFARNGRALHFIDTVHYSLAGNRVVAELLVRHLLRVWPGRRWLEGSGSFATLGRGRRVVIMPEPGPGR